MNVRVSSTKTISKFLISIYLFLVAVGRDLIHIVKIIFSVFSSKKAIKLIPTKLLSFFKNPFHYKTALYISLITIFLLIGYLVIIYINEFKNSPKQPVYSTIQLEPQTVYQRSSYSIETKIIKGDDIYKVMNRVKIPKKLQRQIVKKRIFEFDGKQLNLARNLVINRKVIAFFNSNNECVRLEFATSRKSALQLAFDNNQLQYQHIYYPEYWEDQKGGGIITSSIFTTLEKSNIPASIVPHIVDIFGTDIDFSKDIHKGDEIYVVFKRLFINGLATSQVVATAILLTVQKNEYYAILYPEFNEFRDLNSINKQNDIRYQNGSFVNLARYYYDLKGKSVIRGFIRYPLEFTRVSSKFTDRRLHPVLHKVRAHTGTDFAAPTGTAVRATGDGKVKFLGRKGGYGNTIVLSHFKNIETYYAHLSDYAKGLSVGTKVQQNQTIGYVGSTGLSTGPHLHYEFRVNGKPHDPLSIDLPKPPPLTSNQMDKYQVLLDYMQNQLLFANSNKFISID